MGQPRTSPPLLITQGDPAGIGIELTFQIWRQREALGLAPFALIGSLAALRWSAARLHIEIPLQAIETSHDCASVFGRALPVIEHGCEAESAPGQPDPRTAAGTIRAIEIAVALTQAGDARALVTNPISKAVLKAAGFAHPGHTEFLAELAAAPGTAPPKPVMLIWSELLAVAPVTIHVALKDVPGLLTTAAIVEAATIIDRDMRRWFGLRAPRIAVAGLNPHAGEGGHMGREDIEVIAPAIAALRAAGIDANGPYPADTMFHARARSGYDVALTMYHDQGLIPAKTLAFDDGVNLTLGLPFLRTSPDHGTAFDIAGQGKARPDSLIAAVRLADRLTRP